MDLENESVMAQRAVVTTPDVFVIPLVWEGVQQPRCVIVRGDDREVERTWGIIRRTEDMLQREMGDEYGSAELACVLEADGLEIGHMVTPHIMLP